MSQVKLLGKAYKAPNHVPFEVVSWQSRVMKWSQLKKEGVKRKH